MKTVFTAAVLSTVAITANAQNTGRPVGTTCITQAGWCPITPATAPGTSCRCNTPNGLFVGTAS